MGYQSQAQVHLIFVPSPVLRQVLMPSVVFIRCYRANNPIGGVEYAINQPEKYPQIPPIRFQGGGPVGGIAVLVIYSSHVLRVIRNDLVAANFLLLVRVFHMAPHEIVLGWLHQVVVEETYLLPVFPTGSLNCEDVSLVLHYLLRGLTLVSSWYFIYGGVRNLVKGEIISSSRLLLGQSERAYHQHAISNVQISHETQGGVEIVSVQNSSLAGTDVRARQ
jgi:hypothetical protein